jgi:hypothetical protein
VGQAFLPAAAIPRAIPLSDPNAQLWLDRAAELLKNGHGGVSGAEDVAFATSMMTALYGPESPLAFGESLLLKHLTE